MALDALSEYAQLLNSDEQNIEISVQAGSMTFTFDETITPDTAILLQELEVRTQSTFIGKGTYVGVCSTVVEPVTYMRMYTSLSPTSVDHHEELI